MYLISLKKLLLLLIIFSTLSHAVNYPDATTIDDEADVWNSATDGVLGGGGGGGGGGEDPALSDQNALALSIGSWSGATATGTITGGSGSGTLTASASPNNVCAVGNVAENGTFTVTRTGAGNCSITVTKAADEEYNSISQNTSVATAESVVLTLTAPGDADWSNNSANLSTVVLPLSGGSISYTSTDTNICTVSTAGSVTRIADGNCSISATVAANSYFSSDTETTTFAVALGGGNSLNTDSAGIENDDACGTVSFDFSWDETLRIVKIVQSGTWTPTDYDFLNEPAQVTGVRKLNGGNSFKLNSSADGAYAYGYNLAAGDNDIRVQFYCGAGNPTIQRINKTITIPDPDICSISDAPTAVVQYPYLYGAGTQGTGRYTYSFTFPEHPTMKVNGGNTRPIAYQNNSFGDNNSLTRMINKNGSTNTAASVMDETTRTWKQHIKSHVGNPNTEIKTKLSYSLDVRSDVATSADFSVFSENPPSSIGNTTIYRNTFCSSSASLETGVLTVPALTTEGAGCPDCDTEDPDDYPDTY